MEKKNKVSNCLNIFFSTIFCNIGWFFTELMKIYSSEPSYFSKKRVESGVGFIIAEWGMIYFLMIKINTMSASDFAIWASIQFFVAGYMVTQIQKEKVSDNATNEPPVDESNLN